MVEAYTYMQWKQQSDEIVDMDISNSTFDGNSIGPWGSGGLALHYNIYLDMDYMKQVQG